jgi:small subunit ribosomal protein S3
MSVQRYFIKENALRAAVHEFLSKELERAGYSKVELMKTPLGVRVVVYAARPGMVIGRRGQSIKELTKLLEEKFGLENPQISVAEIEVPELDPAVMAAQIASALQKGVHFRRAAYWALRRIMEAGALGAEIKISGKLTTERARYEKYVDGYLPKAGDPVLKQMREATHYVQLKPGLFGIKVRILPPNAEFPDRVAPVGAKPEEGVKPAEAEGAGRAEEEVEEEVAGAEDE